MNYEGKSVFDLSGGGGNDPQVAINTEDIEANKSGIDVTRQIGFIAAIQLNANSPSMGSTVLDTTPRRFYQSGYVPDPALLNSEIYRGLNMLLLETASSIPFGFRWLRIAETSAVFRFKIRVTFLSITTSSIYVYLRTDQKTAGGVSLGSKQFKPVEFAASVAKKTYVWELDLVEELRFHPNCAFLDIAVFGETSVPGLVNVDYVCSSQEQNYIDIQRLA
jgi:hypothetical protein